MGNHLTPNLSTKEEFEQSSSPREAYQNSFFGGAIGLGDPDSKFLYRSEVKFGIPAQRKEIILNEHCAQPHRALLACQKQHKYFRKFRCKSEIQARTRCIREFWNLPGLEERAYNEYLAARSRYRQTGESRSVKPGWLRSLSLQRKTWEEYQAEKDLSFLTLVKEKISTFLGRKKPPDISVQVDSDRLNDS